SCGQQVPLAPKDTRGCFVPLSQWRWAWHSHGSVVGAPCSRTATPVGETVKAHHPRSNARRATNPNTATPSPFFILFYSRCPSVCPITDTKNNSALSQRKKKTRSHRHAAGQHSPPPTTIAAQETALTSQSQHHNVHHTTVQ
ncbi:hypothetical protein TcCL_ESM07545, partial [Trypanosoma cruzi]